MADCARHGGVGRKVAGAISERHLDPARLAALAVELQAVHSTLRRALQIAREAVEDGDPAAPQRDLLLYCWGFCEALDGHHRSEDAALFPRIIDVRPELAPVIANLKQDHSMIDHLLGGFRHALESGASRD